MRAMKDSEVEWIGEIPERWSVYPARYAFLEIRTKNTNGNITNALKFFNGTIVPKTNFDAEADDYVADTITNYTIVDPGTIMINGLNLNYDLKSLRVGLVKETGVITSAYLALWPDRSRILPEYATYLFKGYETKMAFHNMGAGIRKTLGFKEFRQQPILLPTMEEQKAITSFLDSECARIDAVIEKTRASIEEYKKLKQAVITQAVTKGIRPGRKMKDSGIEWIGEIPEEWEVLSFTKYMCSVVDYRGKTPEKQDEGTLLVTARNIKDGRIDYGVSREYVRSEDYDEIMHRGKVELGDVLFTTEAPLGSVANADRTDFALAQRIIKFRGLPGKLNNYYLKYWIMSEVFQQNLMTFSTGSTAKGIKASKLGQLKQILPSFGEQKEIVDYLDKKTRDFDKLMEVKTSFLDELKSYKQSLIFEYVTGKKEVTA